ncbi:hypothetical protein ACFOY4_04775 [Actinomadura syzygii]|uniref:Peptidase inhibitor family I36 protein n=1 Tax=Actinomadura syzygii TaxID=1427538 RepID=A0A5D0TW85_9ACTN|nr:hypothetical protein [Actinomadura syzygii]TYC10004.1 hypothetical protein FXF65_33440 [Actinomadura syzygii]
MTTFSYRRWSGTRAAVLAATAVIGTAAMTAIGAPDAPAARRDLHGCTDDRVCVYPGAEWSKDRPAIHHSATRIVNLGGYRGSHRVFNNAYRATVRFCTGYSGQGCGAPMGPGHWTDRNLTSINSLVIQR